MNSSTSTWFHHKLITSVQLFLSAFDDEDPMEVEADDLQKEIEACMVCSFAFFLVRIKRHIRYQAELDNTRNSLLREQKAVENLENESTAAKTRVDNMIAASKVHECVTVSSLSNLHASVNRKMRYRKP